MVPILTAGYKYYDFADFFVPVKANSPKVYYSEAAIAEKSMCMDSRLHI